MLDGLGIESAFLVGHSFGGGPTVEAALASPERVRGLVLVDAALGIREDGEPVAGMPALAQGALAVRPVREGLVAALLTNPWMTRRLLGSFVHDPASIHASHLEVYRRPLSVRGTTGAVSDWLPTLLDADLDAASERASSYGGLRAPVVAIWGAEDSITPLAQGERLAALVPGARLVVLDGVGHIPQLEAPAQFEAALVEAARALAGR